MFKYIGNILLIYNGCKKCSKIINGNFLREDLAEIGLILASFGIFSSIKKK